MLCLDETMQSIMRYGNLNCRKWSAIWQAFQLSAGVVFSQGRPNGLIACRARFRNLQSRLIGTDTLDVRRLLPSWQLLVQTITAGPIEHSS